MMNSTGGLYTKNHISRIEHYKQALSLLSWDAKTAYPPVWKTKDAKGDINWSFYR
ncbi:hypothetical protein [Priestia aryabhattai]